MAITKFTKPPDAQPQRMRAIVSIWATLVHVTAQLLKQKNITHSQTGVLIALHRAIRANH